MAQDVLWHIGSAHAAPGSPATKSTTTSPMKVVRMRVKGPPNDRGVSLRARSAVTVNALLAGMCTATSDKPCIIALFAKFHGLGPLTNVVPYGTQSRRFQFQLELASQLRQESYVD